MYNEEPRTTRVTLSAALQARCSARAGHQGHWPEGIRPPCSPPETRDGPSRGCIRVWALQSHGGGNGRRDGPRDTGREKTRAASMTRIAHARASPAVARRRTFCPPSAPSLSKPRRSASAPATPLPHHPSTPASHTPANSLSARPPVGSPARQPTSAYCASGMTSTVVPAVFPGAALAIERGWPACASSCSPCRTRAALWWPLGPESDRAAVLSGRGGRGKRGRAFGNPALKGESLAPERAAAHRSRFASRTALGYACM
jgi:hypothetical protein